MLKSAVYLGAATGIGLILGKLLFSQKKGEKKAKLGNPEAHYFCDEYEVARKAFREMAKRARAELHVLPLEGDCWGGACGDPGES